MSTIRWYAWKVWNLRYWNLRRKNNKLIQVRLEEEYAAHGFLYDKRGRLTYVGPASPREGRD